MDVLEAIRRRQTIGKMKPDAVPRAVIEELLQAAVQAPNHYKVRPWRFVVLTGDGRNQLGDRMAEILLRRFPDADSAALERERAKPLRAPVIIVVGAELPTDSRVLEMENVCAAAAASENILLAAVGLGLGGHWRTGEAARDPEIKEFLGFAREQQLVAFLYLGYPEGDSSSPARPGFQERTSWIT